MELESEGNMDGRVVQYSGRGRYDVQVAVSRYVVVVWRLCCGGKSVIYDGCGGCGNVIGVCGGSLRYGEGE